jgi:hypothetical protein
MAKLTLGQLSNLLSDLFDQERELSNKLLT